MTGCGNLLGIAVAAGAGIGLFAHSLTAGFGGYNTLAVVVNMLAGVCFRKFKGEEADGRIVSAALHSHCIAYIAVLIGHKAHLNGFSGAPVCRSAAQWQCDHKAVLCSLKGKAQTAAGPAFSLRIVAVSTAVACIRKGIFIGRMGHIHLRCPCWNRYMIVRNPVVSAVARIIHGTHVRKGGYLAGISGHRREGSTLGDHRAAGGHIVGVGFTAVVTHTVLIVMAGSIHRLGITVAAGTGKGLDAFCGTGRIRGHFAIVVDMVLTVVFKGEQADRLVITAILLQGNGVAVSVSVKGIAGDGCLDGLGAIFVFRIGILKCSTPDGCGSNRIHLQIGLIAVGTGSGIQDVGLRAVGHIHRRCAAGNGHMVVGNLMHIIIAVRFFLLLIVCVIAQQELRTFEQDILRCHFLAADLDV